MQEEKLGKKALYHITINDASNKPRGLKKKDEDFRRGTLTLKASPSNS